MADSTEKAFLSTYRIVEGPEKGLYDIFVRIEKTVDKNLKIALDAIAPELADRIRDTFDETGARGGRQQWVLRKNPTPLIDTGELRNSIEGVVDEQGSKYVIVVGTDKEYARIHDEGGTTKTDVVYKGNVGGGSKWMHTGNFRDIKIPKREFMFMTTDDAMMVEDRMEDVIELGDVIEGLEDL